MLETKLQSMPKTPRSASHRHSARLSSSVGSAATARALPRHQPLPDRAALGRMAEREARRSAAKTQSRRLARSEARLLTWAIAFACVVCGLMVVYLAAYAHVHLLGDQQAAMHSEWHKKWQENQSLRGEVASLQSPARIGARAAALGLTQDPKRVDYILPPPAGNTLAASTAGTLSDAEQGRESAEAGQSGMESSNLLMTEMGGKADSQVETRGTTSDDNSTDRND